MSYDLFISYSRRDNKQGRITAFIDHLRGEFAATGRELTVFFDQSEIHGMDDWRHRILQGLRESRLLLACLSPNYLVSDYCEWEFSEYLRREAGYLHGFKGVTPIYFDLISGWTDKDFDRHCAAWVADLRRRQHFDLRPWFAEGPAALRDATVQQNVRHFNDAILKAIERSERAERSPGNVDAHNPHFVGRTANLQAIRDNFVLPGNIGVISAMHGMGGLGKTALATEYAHKFADEYGGGRWQVLCAGKTDLRLALADLASAIGFTFTEQENKDPNLLFDRTRHELKALADAGHPPQALLILDNVDQPDLLSPDQIKRLNAGDWLHVLATTRLGEYELDGAYHDRRFLPIDELLPDDALALLESFQPKERFRSEEEREAAKEIVRRLGYFTLAVQYAAVYLGRFAPHIDCAGFLDYLKEEGLEALDTAAALGEERVLHGERSLRITLQPTLNRLTEAQKLNLGFAAILPPDQVPLSWLRALTSETHPELNEPPKPGRPDPWTNALRTLFSLRLLQATGVVDADNQQRVVRVHRLVQELILAECAPAELQKWGRALYELIVARDAALTATTMWADARWELEPLDALANLWAEAEHPRAAWLLSQASQRWYHLAQWSRAEPLMRRALVIDEQSYGPEHPRVAIDLNNLATLLQATNRMGESEPLMRRALAIDEKSYGSEHSEVANYLSNLAQLLQATNRLGEAEPLMRRALAIDERSYGPDHPEVATDLNNLAQLLKATNRLGDAEPLMRRQLEIFLNFTRATGHPHPHLQHAVDNYAALLRQMGSTGPEIRAKLHELAPDFFSE
jgi:tetratricopeptide (TPR) repeat protein